MVRFPLNVRSFSIKHAVIIYKAAEPSYICMTLRRVADILGTLECARIFNASVDVRRVTMSKVGKKFLHKVSRQIGDRALKSEHVSRFIVEFKLI